LLVFQLPDLQYKPSKTPVESRLYPFTVSFSPPLMSKKAYFSAFLNKNTTTQEQQTKELRQGLYLKNAARWEP